MQRNKHPSFCEGTDGACTTPQTTQTNHKPIEIYSFIDPICPECWGLEPIIKKLTIEYGSYFTLRHVIGGKLDVVNRETCPSKLANYWEQTANITGMSCDGDVLQESNSIPSSYRAAVAVKSAELQGKSAGRRFLRVVREQLFLKKKNINRTDVLLECAQTAGLDIEEFKQDLESTGSIKAMKCDHKITSEMGIEGLPSLVLMNIDENKEGIKITGNHPYNIYVKILEELLGYLPAPDHPPRIEMFMKKHKFVAAKELAVVYDKSRQAVDKEMKKLQLKQTVERVPVKYGTFWKYTGDEV